MAGYIGSKSSVTVVSPETDSRYVNVAGDTMTGGLTVTGGRVLVGQTAGDYAQFGKDTGGNAFIDATQSDADFGIYINSTSTGYNKKLGIDSAGRVTMPYQPAFSAYDTLGGNRIYGSGGALIAGSTHYNDGNHYNTSTNTFTAPVAGKYLFYVNIFLNQTAGNGTVRWYLAINDVAPTGDSAGGSSNPYIGCFAPLNADSAMVSGSQVVKLGANDSVAVLNQYENVAVYGGHTGWGGFLIG